MAKLQGKWRLDSSDNFDEYMKAVGVGMVMRKLGGATKPNQEISQDGDEWSIKTLSTVKNTEVKFKLGEAFDETTADGRKVKTTITAEGDTKLVQDQKGDPDSVLTRELTDDSTMTMSCVAKGVTATRVYKRE
ncbi:unnamed protein product [Owenia fusiformis]|uniref:Cytosolic fatty-acid binding proteins domain-containing protein n=1 Tax=Owenia fusiformis TaxID=6347 RepID=A0A8S4Q8W1_OWEFU|nr:unnamed protein product [Owenia fusiformis]